MFIRIQVLLKATFLVGLMFLSGCVSDDSRLPPVPADLPGYDDLPVCTREFNPVCAIRNGQEQTFGNPCEAESAGWSVLHDGQCRYPGADDERICTREYDPVCGERNGRVKSFSNECVATSAGYRLVSESYCDL